MRNGAGRKKTVVLFFVLLFWGMSVASFAQPGDPGTNPDVPVTGIEWLLVAGGIFGARKIYNRIKKN